MNPHRIRARLFHHIAQSEFSRRRRNYERYVIAAVMAVMAVVIVAVGAVMFR